MDGVNASTLITGLAGVALALVAFIGGKLHNDVKQLSKVLITVTEMLQKHENTLFGPEGGEGDHKEISNLREFRHSQADLVHSLKARIFVVERKLNIETPELRS